MNLRPEEISSIIKEQIKNYENKVELKERKTNIQEDCLIAEIVPKIIKKIEDSLK